MENFTLDVLQKKISYTFINQEILKRALIHSSAESENNQRLEFLGDAVLELIISEYLYNSFEQYEEGRLTKVRAAIVTESALAKAAEKLSLGEYVVFGKGEQKSNGKEKPSILSDTVEALIGAVYLDGGFGEAKRFSMELLQEVIGEALTGKGFTNYKSVLQEYYNKNGVFDIQYTVIKEEGPQHDKVFYIRLSKGKKEISTGIGRSKKQAEQEAAKNALDILNIAY